MSETHATAEVNRELDSLRQAVVELGIPRAEAMNALAELARKDGAGSTFDRTRDEIVDRILNAADNSPTVVARLAKLDER